MKDKKIGVVGLGRMGANMARRLVDCGYKISGLFDINDEVASSLARELEMNKSASLSELTASADIILTVVTNDAAMENIFYGEDNLFIKAQGKVFINCATLSPEIHQKLETSAQEIGASSLEACMASSIPQARNGELYLMIGGDKSVFESI